jgi:cysteinyl-tRNA synthetase
MSKSYLGEVFDIHGGGLDLIFPHHENELAQSRCAHGTKKMVNVWMHNGFLQVEGQKMSKSLGNFVTINEVLQDWPGETVRFNMLRTHYRQPIDWTIRGLEESTSILSEWRDSMWSKLSFQDGNRDYYSTLPISERALESMQDDLNFPGVITELHRQAKSTDIFEIHKLFATLNFLGVASFDGMQLWAKRWEPLPSLSKTVNSLITSRLAARAAKDWKESDRIRDELAAMGVTIKDNKDGTTSWEVKR